MICFTISEEAETKLYQVDLAMQGLSHCFASCGETAAEVRGDQIAALLDLMGAAVRSVRESASPLIQQSL